MFTRDRFAMVVAALDLGSNSFHVLVTRVDRDGLLTKLGSRKETLRLGAGIDGDGRIPEELFRRALGAASRLVDYARSLRARRVLVVGTSALRDAQNGAAFAHALLLRAGVQLELLSGESEGQLVYLGATRGLPASTGSIGVVDIGGRSVEVAIGTGARCSAVESLPLGFLRFPRARAVGGALDASALAARVAEVAGPLAARLRELGPRTWLFTGGTARGFSAAARRVLPLARDPLDRADVERVARELIAAGSTRLSQLEVNPARRDVLGTGACLLASVASVLDVQALRVAPGGLREGVILRELAAASAARTSTSVAAGLTGARC